MWQLQKAQSQECLVLRPADPHGKTVLSTPSRRSPRRGPPPHGHIGRSRTMALGWEIKAPDRIREQRRIVAEDVGSFQSAMGLRSTHLRPPPPPPIVGPQGQQPPWMSMPLPPGALTSSTAATALSPAEQKLKDVASMLKKANPEALTPELQNFVAEETKAATKQDAKTLYTAVDELTKAREALDTALLARSNLMAQWRAFLTMSWERFRQYTDHFQQQEQAHQENIKTAKETLQKAKADFNSKEEEATVISDEDTESKDVSTKESAHKILEGLCHMTDSLQKLSEQAEKEHTAEEERKAKRPRQKDTDVVDAAMSSGGLPSMQPFGAPGH